MLDKLTGWFRDIFISLFGALWNLIQDAAVAICDALLAGLAGLLSLIPVPAFLSSGLQSIYGQLDPGILYVLNATGLPVGLGIIGTAYAFRLARKAATLFQW